MVKVLCEYGCGKTAIYTLKNGKFCCEESNNKCPEIKRKNSKGLKKAYKDGRKKSRILEFRPETSWNKGKTILNYNDVFVENSNRKTSIIKDIILRDNLREYKCEKCNNVGEWEGQELILELDHINGDGRDNRLENLRFLCPNCHSQTPTFRGRTNTSNKKVEDEEMIDAIKISITMSEALRKCGLVEKGGNFKRVRRIMGKYKVQLKKKEIKESKTKNKILNKEVFCPQCGSKFKGRGKVCIKCSKENQRKVERPPYERLKKEVHNNGYVATGKFYGVSDNTIRKWVKCYEKENSYPSS